MKTAIFTNIQVKLSSLGLAAFIFWWYSRFSLWLGILMGLLSGILNYAIGTSKRINTGRRLYFIGLFLFVFTSLFIIIEIWDPKFILSWAREHLDWTEYYISGVAPGALSFPCNRVVSQVFFGNAHYFEGFFTWYVPFPQDLNSLLVVMLPFLLTGVVFGRGFCGWICPFGGLPEFFSTGSRQRWHFNKLEENKATSSGIKYARLNRWVGDIKYGILVALILLSVYFSFPAICIMCPALWLSFIPVLWLVVALVVVFAVLTPLMTKRKWWCHICPVGAIVSLLDRISFFRVHVNSGKCIKCFKCIRDCKTFAMSVNAREQVSLAHDDCTRCGTCISECPVGAVHINYFGTGISARQMFISLSIVAAFTWYTWFAVIVFDKLAALLR